MKTAIKLVFCFVAISCFISCGNGENNSTYIEPINENLPFYAYFEQCETYHVLNVVTVKNENELMEKIDKLNSYFIEVIILDNISFIENGEKFFNYALMYYGHFENPYFKKAFYMLNKNFSENCNCQSFGENFDFEIDKLQDRINQINQVINGNYFEIDGNIFLDDNLSIYIFGFVCQ